MSRQCQNPEVCAKIMKVGQAVDAAFRLLAEVDQDRLYRQLKLTNDPFLVALAEANPGSLNQTETVYWNIGLVIAEQGHIGIPAVPPLNIVLAGVELLGRTDTKQFEHTQYHWLSHHQYKDVV